MLPKRNGVLLFLAMTVAAGVLLLSPLRGERPIADSPPHKSGHLFLEGLARSGKADAQALLGEMYLKGKGVSKDYAKARKWLQAAAKQNDVDAQRNLGIMYDGGIGVEADREAAAEWFGKAMRQGDVVACYKLGFGYRGEANFP